MQDALPPFLARLGLDTHADERAVRRAYARLLKQIDQDADAEGFQSLRQAYEVALLWLDQQRLHIGDAQMADEAAATAGERDTPPPTPARINDSEQAARDVLQELHDKLSAGWPKDRGAARAWLDALFEGERLAGMDARYLFEWGVAGMLADGWQPGKEYLFSAAMDCFGWREDRGRLKGFHHVGGVVAAAIAELEFFDSLPDKTRKVQRNLIRRLRQDHRPRTSLLLRQMPVLDQIAHLYPHWLHVITRTRNIAQWREWNRIVPRWRRWLSRPPRTAPAQPPAQKKRMGFGGAFLVLLVLGGLANFFSSPSSQRPAHAPASYGPPPARSVAPAMPPAPYTSAPRSPLESATFDPAYLVPPRVTYPPAARRLGQEGRVTVMALVNPDGKVRRAQVRTSSGHPLLDEAAVAAVQGATFVAARDSLGNATSIAYAIPINFKLTDGQDLAGRTPRSYGEAIRDTVRPYIVFADQVSGNPAAEVTLTLTQDGRIQTHKLTKSSGDKAWDAAVLRAVQRVPRLPADQNGKVAPAMVITFRPKA